MQNESTAKLSIEIERSYLLLKFFQQGGLKNPNYPLWHGYFKEHFKEFDFEIEEFNRSELFLLEKGYLDQAKFGSSINIKGRSCLSTYRTKDQFKRFIYKTLFEEFLSDEWISALIVCDEQNIPRFLSSTIVIELDKEDRIEQKSDKFGDANFQVRKKQGFGFEKFIDQSNNVFNTGSIGNIQQATSGNQSSYDNASSNPITQTLSLPNANSPSAKSWLEIASWIAGIIACIATLYILFK